MKTIKTWAISLVLTIKKKFIIQLFILDLEKIAISQKTNNSLSNLFF